MGAERCCEADDGVGDDGVSRLVMRMAMESVSQREFYVQAHRIKTVVLLLCCELIACDHVSTCQVLC